MSKLIDNVADRYIKCSKNGNVSLIDELNILYYLVERFKLKTISQYAKQNNLTYPGTKKRIESGKLMTVELGNIIYIIN